VNPILAGVALAVIAGAIVVVSVRDARVVVLAMAMVLVLSAVLADPLAAPAGLAARFVAAILAAYLLWIAARDRTDDGLPSAPTEGSRIGWPAEVLLAGAAAIVGFAVEGLGAPPVGPALAGAAGFAIAALTVAPVLTGRDVFRVGIGLVLLMDAALLIRAALGGTPEPLEQLLTAGLMVTIAAVVAAMARAARADGVGGFAFATDAAASRPTRPPEARPREAHRQPDRLPPLPGDLNLITADERTTSTTPRRRPRPDRFSRPTRPDVLRRLDRSAALDQPDLGLVPTSSPEQPADVAEPDVTRTSTPDRPDLPPGS
jgi:hypothetical protein